MNHPSCKDLKIWISADMITKKEPCINVLLHTSKMILKIIIFHGQPM